MGRVAGYQDLDLWKKAMDLSVRIYQVSRQFPADERFGLTSQIRRAAVSVAANIAEGAGRKGTREFLHFLGVAGGSLAETETFLILACRLEIATADNTKGAFQLTEDIGRMLTALRRSLQAKLK